MKPISRLMPIVIVLFIGIIISSIVIKSREILQLNEEREIAIFASIPVDFREEVYDGMTLEELSDKLETIMDDALDGYGEFFAEYSIELGIDPYLALAIVMHETGCKWECSNLAKNCNNFGGMKGSVDGESCGSYKKYPTKKDGLKGFLDNIYNKYYEEGLTTPEKINPKYAEDPKWASKVNKYIEQIKQA